MKKTNQLTMVLSKLFEFLIGIIKLTGFSSPFFSTARYLFVGKAHKMRKQSQIN